MIKFASLAIGMIFILLPTIVNAGEISPELGQVGILDGRVAYFGPGVGDRVIGTITYVTAPKPTYSPAPPSTTPDCIDPCGSNQLLYQELGGTVQYNGTYAYNIFWEPSNSGVSYSTYNTDMNNLMSDENQTGYYGNLTQYYQEDTNGTVHYITNHSSLQGSFVDTSVFPNQSTSNSLTPAQIDTELSNVVQAKGWPTGYKYQYNVFLGVNPSSGQGENLSDGACGWHTVSTKLTNVAYTATRYGSLSGCAPPDCPNGCTIDSALATLAHETMETVTDPVPITGWADSSNQEIVDKCEGSQSLDYMNIVYDGNKANHFPGGPDYYLLESMWDNQEQGCAPYGPTYP